MTSRRTLGVVFGTLLIVASAGGALVWAKTPAQISIAASQQGGAWYPLAVAVGELLKTRIGALESYSVLPGGGAANPVAVDQGRATFGISTAVSSVDAYNGAAPYKQAHDKIRLLAAQYNQYVQFVTLKGSGINSVKDLKGKRLNVGARGLTGEVVARAILQSHGMSYNDLGFVSYLGFADATNEMRDGRVDAIIWIADAPFGQLVDLSQSHEITLIPFTAEQVAAIRKIVPGLIPATIPAGTYRHIAAAVPTLMSPNVLLVGAGLDPDFVYEVTKVYVENFARLQEASPVLRQVKDPSALAKADLVVPYHLGAARYYKERGWQ
jgi:TRAP transporter TAXI family solute receptor